MRELPLVPVIVGPTAVGKTAVAEMLAEKWNVLVVSADSRQVYRQLDVGTAKPDARVLERVDHVGLDLVEPGQRFSAGQFARAARGWIEDADSERQVIVVGGTGLYVKALTDGLFEEPYIDEDRLRQLRASTRGIADLEAWAKRLDPDIAAHGRQRASRIVEVALLTGYPLSWWHRRSPGRPTIRPWFVRVTLPRDQLYARIGKRVGEMLRRGWVEEVRAVLASGVRPDSPGLDAVGYPEIIRHLDGELAFDELPPIIAQSTRRYAKRQETWFRHQLGVHPVMTVSATESARCMAKQILNAWEKRND